MTDYQKMYTTLFNAVTDALKKWKCKTTVTQKNCLSPLNKRQKRSISQHRTKIEAILNAASAAMPPWQALSKRNHPK